MSCNEVVMDSLKYKGGEVMVTVTGMVNSDRMVLQNNGGDDLEIHNNGSYTFSNKLANGENYDVEIKEMPSSHNCEVRNGVGTISKNDVNGVEVVCSEKAWKQDAYLKASNAESGDRFGYSVAIDGDILVVGANGEDSNSTNIDNEDSHTSGLDDGSADDSGAVYIFKKDSNGDWVQDAYLKGSNAEGGDKFGENVALSGDVIVVGVWAEDSNSTNIDNRDDHPTVAESNNSATFAGAAYVFKRDSNDNWIQDAYLKASNTRASDNFGISVAIDGNIIVVGAYTEDNSSTNINNADGHPTSGETNNSASDSGAAYVFKKNSSGDWVQDAYLKASNAESGDRFGGSVAISEDVIVVGAKYEDSNFTSIENDDGQTNGADDGSADDSGAVYVFKKVGDDWVQDAYLKASNADSNDRFGESVAIDGDIIIVDAYGEDSNSTNIDNIDGSASNNNDVSYAGAVYVFKRDSSNNWVQDAYLKASNAEADDVFGMSVAISGDVIVVGAEGEDGSSTNINNTDGSASTDNSLVDSGAVYVFKRDSSGNWVQDAYLKASNARTNDSFGMSVAIGGDTIVVGTVYEDNSSTNIENTDSHPTVAESDNGASNSGAVYVFKRQ